VVTEENSKKARDQDLRLERVGRFVRRRKKSKGTREFKKTEEKEK